MYQQGELDTLTLSPVVATVKTVKTDADLLKDLVSSAAPMTSFYGFTTNKPPFDDVRVRQAFSLAIDRESLVEHLDPIRFLPAHTFAPAGTFGSPAGDATSGVFFDAQAARDKLAEAGYPGGEGFPSVTLMHIANDLRTATGRQIQQMWQETLGVEVKIVAQAGNVHLNAISPHTTLEKMPHIWHLAWMGDFLDEHNWVHTVFNPTVSDNWTRMQLDDPMVGEYITEFNDLTLAAATEPDPDKRLEMYARAEQLLVYDIAAVIPLFHWSIVNLTKPYLQRSYPSFGGNDVENWRIEK
jgi:oligopeptide transport system substrate-binding protein